MKQFITSTLLVLTVTVSTAQSLVKNEVDEFTKNQVKQTSWEVLHRSMDFVSYLSASSINNGMYLELKLMKGMGDVFSIDGDSKLMFKFKDGTVLAAICDEYTITCTGCGARGYSGSQAEGIHAYYNVSADLVRYLRNKTVLKIRVYTNDGYIEGDVKPKHADVIKDMVNLL